MTDRLSDEDMDKILSVILADPKWTRFYEARLRNIFSQAKRANELERDAAQRITDALAQVRAYDAMEDRAVSAERELASIRQSAGMPEELDDAFNAGLARAAEICREQAQEPECPERAEYCARAIEAEMRKP